MNTLNRNCKTSFVKPEFLKKAQRANPRLYDIGCYNDNLALMLAPEYDVLIRLAQESRSKLSDLIKPFDYKQLNDLYDLFVPLREKSAEQRFFLESVDMIFDGVERCKQTIAKRTYFGTIDPFIQNTIEGNFSPQISAILANFEKFHSCLKEEMVEDLRYFNSLEHEVMQAYNATSNELPIPLPQAPIAPPTILPPSPVTSTLEILIEDIQVQHRSDMKNLLNKIHKLKNHKGGPPPPDY
ncbi:hypothetical protein Tco_0014146 [Tanacetum coccineum]